MRSLGSKGILKRALPLLATFAVALFITSFFVDLRGPRFGRGRWHRGQEMQRLRDENEQLRAEMERLRAEMERREFAPMHHPGDDELEMNFEVPPPPMPLVAPVAPHAHN